MKDKARAAVKFDPRIVLNLVRESPQPIVAHDARGKITVWSRGAERIFGYSRDEIVGKNFSKLLPKGIERTVEMVAKVLSGELDAFESRMVSKDGRLFDVITIVSPLKDDEGNLIAIIRLFGNITESKRIVRELKISEEEKRLILDNICELIAFQGLDNRILAANRAAGESVGQTPEQLVGRFCYEIWHRRKKPCLGCPVVVARKTGQPAEAEITSPDGRVWHIRGYPVKDESGRVTGVVEITSEITERKRMEQGIQRAREFAEAIVETVREPLVVLDAGMKVIAANRAFYHTFRMAPEETGGRSVYEIGNGAWDIPKLHELLENILPNNTSFDNFEVEHDFPIIGRRAMLLNARRIYSKNNKTQMVLLAIEDITERKRAERSVQESEKKYRKLAESTSDVILQIDLEGNFIYMNKSFEKESGYSFDEIRGRNIKEFLTPESYKIAMERLKMWKEGARALPHYEVWLKAKDGRVTPFELSTSPIIEEEKLVAIEIVARNITERKRAEDKLRRSEERYRMLVEMMNEGLSMVDKDDVVVYANDRYCEMLGYSREELLGRSLYDLVDKSFHKELRQQLKSNRKGERIVYETAYVRKDGQRIFALVSATPFFDADGNYSGAFAVVSDITERKQAEERLRESEEKYRSLVESSGDSIYMLDRDLRYLSANRELLSRLGLSEDEIVGRLFAEIHPPEATEELAKAVRKVLETGKIVRQEHWSDKLKGVFLRTLSPVRDSKTGEIRAITVVSKDITELKSMQESLRGSLERQRALIDFSPDGIIITDVSRIIIDCNRSALRMLGLSNKEELLGKDILDLIPPGNHGSMIKDIKESFESGLKRELRYELMNGVRVPSEISISTVPDATGRPSSFIFMIRDITERVKAEEKMREFIYQVNDIYPGECYLHHSHQAAFNIFAQLTLHGVVGLCFTREKPEVLTKYGVPKQVTIIISSVPLAGFETIDGIQQISLRISEFLKENKGSVVLLDGLEYLVSRWGFDVVYKFLQEKRFNIMDSEAVLLMPVDLSAFTDKERALLASEIRVIR